MSAKPTATGKTAAPERTTQIPTPTTQRPAMQTLGLQASTKKPQTSAPIRVSGPSFLGLSDEPVMQDRRRSSDDLYRTNWGMRAFVVFIILAAASGLIFLQWRSGHVQASQHAAPPATASQANDAASPTAPPANPTNNAAASTPATTGAKATANENGAAGGSKPAQNTDQPKTEAKLNSVPNPATAVAQPKAASTTKSVPQADSIRDGHEVATGKTPSDLEQPVRQAESYLQGKGVTKSCDQALNILRTASDHGNPRAQIKLGALYATGNCTAVDKVAAYRYFSRAMRSQPNNTWLEQYRSSLWSNMNANERKQAMEVVR